MSERKEDVFTPKEEYSKKTQEIEPGVFLFWKKISETTFQATKRFQEENPQYASTKMCFAGRLDPMAKGWLVFLLGEKVHLKDQYIQKEKVYTASILVGASTDTDDIFGLLEENRLGDYSLEEIQSVRDIVLETGKRYERVFEQKFSPFSSKHVEGKPLFWWATEKKLDEIEIPTHEVEVMDFQVSPMIHLCEKNTWLKYMTERFQNIEGDFRNEKIINQWQEVIKKYQGENLYHLTVRIHASTGMYVRQLIRDIGEEIGVPMSVVEITREEALLM